MMTLQSAYRTTMNPPSPGFGALLRQWREMRGLSQLRLADLMDCDMSVISRWESGSRRPKLSNITALADALELTGAHRAMFIGSANYVEHPLTEAQAAHLAGWRDSFTRR